MKTAFILMSMACLASAATAKPAGEIGYPKGALGYDALVQADYATAERQLLLDDSTARNDPAKLINLGQIYWKTGRIEMAVRVLEEAARSEDMELILADGSVVSSRDAARKTLEAIRK